MKNLRILKPYPLDEIQKHQDYLTRRIGQSSYSRAIAIGRLETGHSCKRMNPFGEIVIQTVWWCIVGKQNEIKAHLIHHKLSNKVSQVIHGDLWLSTNPCSQWWRSLTVGECRKLFVGEVEKVFVTIRHERIIYVGINHLMGTCNEAPRSMGARGQEKR